MIEIDLRGKWALVVGVADDRGFGWAIAKALAEAGAKISIGTWAPMTQIFTKSLHLGKFDESRKLRDGSMMEFESIYPIDANYDVPENVPSEVAESKRYRNLTEYTLSEVAHKISCDVGQLDILVHSLANAVEITRPLMKTTRNGYLSAIGASSYSFIGLLQSLTPHMRKNGSALALTYSASQRTIPGYGGGMSSAKAALESDIRTLAWELGRQKEIRINAISAGPLKTRAADAIGSIDQMMAYSRANAPLAQNLEAHHVAETAAFILSPLASRITGSVVYVDNGLHTMGVAVDSVALSL